MIVRVVRESRDIKVTSEIIKKKKKKISPASRKITRAIITRAKINNGNLQ